MSSNLNYDNSDGAMGDATCICKPTLVPVSVAAVTDLRWEISQDSDDSSDTEDEGNNNGCLKDNDAVSAGAGAGAGAAAAADFIVLD